MRQMNDGKKVLDNFAWRLAERIGAQGVTFLVSIVLARLLDPKVYGTIALVTVFTSIMQVFVDSGLGTALIQKKEADELDFSTVFFANISFSLVLYLLMYLIAPYISTYYEQPELTSLIRVLSVIIIIGGVKNIQQAYVARNMLFKKFFWSTLFGTIGAAGIGIWMAVLGYGVWALVVQMIFNSFVDTVILWITVKWRPKLAFSLNRLQGLWSFGWKMLLSSLFATIYTDLRKLIIGKFYTDEDLAFFDKGRQFPNLIVSNVNTSIDSVLLPAMSKQQDNVNVVKAMTQRSIEISTYIMFPIMMGLAVCAEPIVRILLTSKWIPCVPYLRIYCLTLAFYPIHTANLNAIKALGRSDLYLKIEIIKKIIGVLTLVLSARFGVLAIAYAMIIEDFVGQIICTFPSKKLFHYSYVMQIRDITPQLFLTLFMGITVFLINYLSINDAILLIIQILIGILIYIFGSLVLKIRSFKYLSNILRGITERRKAV